MKKRVSSEKTTSRNIITPTDINELQSDQNNKSQLQDSSHENDIIMESPTKSRFEHNNQGRMNKNGVLDERVTIGEKSEERYGVGDSNGNTSAAIGGVLQSTVPAWMNTLVMTGLIFGGCCSNVCCP